jgi:hypothetical protein
MGGNTYVVNVSVAKYEEDVTPPAPISTNRGLLAFYSFDDNNADDMTGNKHHGMLSGGSFITDTPNGSGKALSLNAKDFVSIGSNPLDGKSSQTISMWIKDFAIGTLFKLSDGNCCSAPTLYLNNEMQLTACITTSNQSGSRKASSVALTNFADKWTMVTIVITKTGLNKNNGATGTVTFYVNGRSIDSVEAFMKSYGTAMTIGGSFLMNGNVEFWNSAFKVDNVRIHGVALSNDEIEAIYNAEKQ